MVDDALSVLIGLFCAVPYVVVPYAFPSEEEAKIPWRERYITKANVWIAIFSFIGNYWYTHYFYRVLKVSVSHASLMGMMALSPTPRHTN